MQIEQFKQTDQTSSWKTTRTKHTFFIDVTVHTDRNIYVKEFDKLSKYKDFQIEIKRIWHLKTTVIPVVLWKGNSKSFQVEHWRTKLTRNTNKSPYEYDTPPQSTEHISVNRTLKRMQAVKASCCHRYPSRRWYLAYTTFMDGKLSQLWQKVIKSWHWRASNPGPHG